MSRQVYCKETIVILAARCVSNFVAVFNLLCRPFQSWEANKSKMYGIFADLSRENLMPLEFVRIFFIILS